jgi:hypothetical protein
MSDEHLNHDHRPDHDLGDLTDLDPYLDSEIDADLDWERWGAVPSHAGEPWTEPWGGGGPPDPSHPTEPGRRRRVTHLVLVDGLPADHWVDASPDGDWSRSVPPRRRGAGAVGQPHQRELRWLDSLVGGRAALMALDTAGLVAPTAVSLPPTITDPEHAARAEAIRTACVRYASTLFHDPEMPAATHHALESVLRADPAFLLRSSRDDTAAGAIVWVAGHANGSIGQTGDLSARDLWHRTGVSSSAASRGATMLQRLRAARGTFIGSDLTDDDPPPGAPRLKATGHPSILTSATRTLIAVRRDAALAAMPF